MEKHSDENIDITFTETSGITRTYSYDAQVMSGTRIHLEWVLEDLGEFLGNADDLAASDPEWFLDRAQRIFDSALQRKKGDGDAEDS